MLISSENLSFGFLGESLLENINFNLSEGDRVGLIGGNGEGKTTLLRLILGELDPESGVIFRKNGAKIWSPRYRHNRPRQRSGLPGGYAGGRKACQRRQENKGSLWCRGIFC